MTLLSCIAGAILCAGLVAAQAPVEPAIAEALRNLGSASFSKREEASKYLWSRGTDAEAALVEAAKSDDPEIATRAKEILERIRSGILPDTPPETVDAIKRYKQGSAQDKAVMLGGMLSGGPGGPPAFLRLIAGEAAGVQRAVMAQHQGAVRLTAMKMISTGKLDDAAKLLRTGALSGNRQLMGDLAAFAYVTGTLDRELAEINKAAGPDNTAATNAAAFLLRAKGDFKAAAAAAKAANDKDLLITAVMDGGDWAGLMDALKDDFHPPPALDNDIEQLGAIASFYRLSGKDADFGKCVRKILVWGKAHPSDSWYAVEALLLNDRLDEALLCSTNTGKYLLAAEMCVEQNRLDDAVAIEADAVAAGSRDREGLRTLLAPYTDEAATPVYLPDSAGGGSVGSLKITVAAQPAETPESTKAELDKDPMNAIRNYLHGIALIKAGNEREGREYVVRGALLPLADAPTRQKLEEELRRRGLEKDANYQNEIIFRTAELDSWHMQNACSLLADAASVKKDYRSEAELRERSRLLCHEKSSAMLVLGADGKAGRACSGYLWSTFRIAYARARDCASRKDTEGAIKYALLCAQARPFEMESLCRGLRAEFGAKTADLVFAAVYDRLVAGIPETRLGAFRMNNAAWLAARYGKRMDEALKLSEQAVKLRPDNPPFLDTQAELLFQLKRAKEAIKIEQRCIELAPNVEFFKKQVKRFESGDTSSDPE